MELYEKFRRLDVDTSPLSLARGDEDGGYFCTPVGAKVIGWAGVDGIHFCFIEGFGDMVFSVSPMNPPGKYVRPLARSFEDFLRLLLSCGDTAAIEQAWMWNRGEFDAFLETYPPDAGQQAVMDALAEQLGLTPMEEPFAYIKEVQSGFDYGSIPYSEEYHANFVPEEPRPPERPEWEVYFDGGFGQHFGHDKPGIEVPVGKTFAWGGSVWHIPAVYACGAGLVADICMEIDPDRMRAFWERWRPWLEEGRPFTPEDRDRQMADNPMSVNADFKVEINGKTVRQKHGSGFGWTPPSCRPDWEQGELNQQDYEGIWLMEHYGLNQERCWMFWRVSFPWATKTKPTLKTLTLSLEQNPVCVPGPRFTVSGTGENVPFTHPVTGQEYTLEVAEYEQQELSPEHLTLMEDEEWEYPPHYTAMTYTVWPELPKGAISVQDCGEGDHPRRKAAPNPNGPSAVSFGMIGVARGIMPIVRSDGQKAEVRGACSAMRFQPEEHIEWRMIFYHKTVENIEVELLPL